MANLKSLIRVRRHTVEQKQKILSDLYRKAEALAQERADLLAQFEAERARLIEMDVQMLSYFGPYSEALKERVAVIDQNAKTLDARIHIAQEDMRAAFAELKKVDITQGRRKDDADNAQNKKESTALDEIAIESYRRKLLEEEG